MKNYIIILLFMLCACASQNLETKNIKLDDTLEHESQTDQAKYIVIEEPTLQTDSTKGKLNEKNINTPESEKRKEEDDKVTYGPVRHQDTTVSFKTLPSVNDSSKEQGTSGYITKGSDGLKRIEVRDVYSNGKYSHTETVKETYLVSKQIDEQKWIGTKEVVKEDDGSWESLGYHFYKKYDSFETCNVQADELARINSKNGWLSTLCDGPNLYYTLRD